MGRKLSDILKDRRYFSEERENQIHQMARKEADEILKQEVIKSEASIQNHISNKEASNGS